VRAIDPVTLGNTWIALTNHYLMNRDLFAPGGSVIAKCGAALKAQLRALLHYHLGSTPLRTRQVMHDLRTL